MTKRISDRGTFRFVTFQAAVIPRDPNGREALSTDSSRDPADENVGSNILGDADMSLLMILYSATRILIVLGLMAFSCWTVLRSFFHEMHPRNDGNSSIRYFPGGANS